MPPLTLTPKAFYAKPVGQQPGADYANYLSYIRKRRAPTVAARPAVAAAPVSPLQSIVAAYQASIPTQAQLGTRSSQAVADAIAQGIAANKAGIAAQNTQLTNQADRAQGFALALAKATAPNPDQIGGFYREAADRLRGYGTGLTGAVAADQQAQAEATKAAVERVTGGAGVTSGYDPNAIRNAAQMSGVVIPGSSLESQAAAAAAQAQYGRAASTANIGQIAQDYIAKQNDLRAGVTAANAALEAQRPQLYRQELASETTQSRQDIATLLSALGLMNTQAGTQSLVTSRGAATTGKLPGTNKPTPGNWTNPDTGLIEKIPSGSTIKNVNGTLTPVPINSKVVTTGGVDKIVPIKPPAGSKASGTSHLQQKTTKGGDIYLFDPATGSSYMPGDTKNPIDPNTLKGKSALTSDKLRTYKARVRSGMVKDLTADPKTLPAAIYAKGVAGGIPGWVVAQVIKAEAKNHKGQPAWDNVLKPGWVAGR